ncbi:hypothetical protein TNIN_329141 [Trichonephila inaurata madagascariensis]|uniref:Uncharacterized protein n=1 Tax=Trichonephila inaurata madagascariensis TaxID=2747483 RepID=A0A8X7BQM8_9ARAC|nr:hypothetical protein TNIN_329141 [Trichonephila inaurata madagascariensis]
MCSNLLPRREEGGGLSENDPLGESRPEKWVAFCGSSTEGIVLGRDLIRMLMLEEQWNVSNIFKHLRDTLGRKSLPPPSIRKRRNPRGSRSGDVIFGTGPAESDGTCKMAESAISSRIGRNQATWSLKYEIEGCSGLNNGKELPQTTEHENKHVVRVADYTATSRTPTQELFWQFIVSVLGCNGSRDLACGQTNGTVVAF